MAGVAQEAIDAYMVEGSRVGRLSAGTLAGRKGGVETERFGIQVLGKAEAGFQDRGLWYLRLWRNWALWYPCSSKPQVTSASPQNRGYQTRYFGNIVGLRADPPPAARSCGSAGCCPPRARLPRRASYAFALSLRFCGTAPLANGPFLTGNNDRSAKRGQLAMVGQSVKGKGARRFE